MFYSLEEFLSSIRNLIGRFVEVLKESLDGTLEFKYLYLCFPYFDLDGVSEPWIFCWNLCMTYSHLRAHYFQFCNAPQSPLVISDGC